MSEVTTECSDTFRTIVIAMPKQTARPIGFAPWPKEKPTKAEKSKKGKR